jgi:hypothetical protein
MRTLLGTLAVAAALTVGTLAGFVIAGIGDGTQTYQATVAQAAVPGAVAELRVDDGEATLVADERRPKRILDSQAILIAEGLPEPPGAYQLWLMPEGSDTPEPSSLFLPRNGVATVAVPGAEDAAAVLVTREPKQGSSVPSEQPVMTITMS